MISTLYIAIISKDWGQQKYFIFYDLAYFLGFMSLFASQAGGELLFCLCFVSSVFFFFILVGIDIINSTWIYFPIPAGHDTVSIETQITQYSQN